MWEAWAGSREAGQEIRHKRDSRSSSNKGIQPLHLLLQAVPPLPLLLLLLLPLLLLPFLALEQM